VLLPARVERAVTVSPPVSVAHLRGGEYAVLRHRGPYSDMRAAYEWLYGTWLVQSGRDAADAPVFEEYLNSPKDTPPAELLTEICLPLAYCEELSAVMRVPCSHCVLHFSHLRTLLLWFLYSLYMYT
jgi:hypothetical protein